MLALSSKFFRSCSILMLAGGCAVSRPGLEFSEPVFAEPRTESVAEPIAERLPQIAPRDLETTEIQPVDYRQGPEEIRFGAPSVPSDPRVVGSDDSLHRLEQLALEQNPRLRRLSQEYQAAAARSQYADKLPDPRFGANVFGNPIETAAGSQRANINFSQTLPWLGRLNAEQQRAFFEAYAVQAELEAERLRVLAAIRAGWYRLYVLDKQIEVAETNQQLLQSLIKVANARIAAGNASQGDVLLGTLELSQLEERLLTYHRQRRGVEAEINRLAARPAEVPLASPEEVPVAMPALEVDEIYQMALDSQPELEAARLRTQATRWGIEVARLMRRPELMVSASYFVTDDNRPPSAVVKVGEDPWALGAQVSIPIWHEKYNAMRNEATWRHYAAHNSIEELADRYEALIVDLMAEARRAQETAALYESTILPQARQTLAVDQEGYTNGVIEFDRVVRDYRNLLTLELGYHQAVGELGMANARLRQAAGFDFPLQQSGASR